MTVPDCTENPFRARLGEPKTNTDFGEAIPSPSAHPEFFPSPLMVTRTKRTTELEEKSNAKRNNGEIFRFLGNHFNLSCVRFSWTLTACVATKNNPDLLQTSQSGERNVVVVDDETRSSRGYLRKYLFSTPLHFDWPSSSSSSKFILRFCVRPSLAGLAGLFPSLH